VEYVTSDEFPEDSAVRIQNAHTVLTQLTGSGLMAMASIAQLGLNPTATASTFAYPSNTTGDVSMIQQPTSNLTNAAEEALNSALGLQSSSSEKVSTSNGLSKPLSVTENTEKVLDAKEIQGKPTLNLLVHNMFDKEEETDEGWQDDIREDFEEECSKYGKITNCIVMHLEPGGKIYASFDTETSAKNCALALAGRWFDKRQLRVEYVKDEDLPNSKNE